MLHVFTFYTDENRLTQLKETQQNHSVKVNYLFNSSWNGYTDKILYMIDTIKNIHDDDVVCFIDAYDVLVNSTSYEILDKFKSYNCKLLIGAELNCYPSDYKSQMDNISDGLKLNTPIKYVNSGGYIGYKKNVHNLLTWKSTQEIEYICSNGGDQTYFIEYYIHNYMKDSISLDYTSKVFQNMHLISWKEVDFRGGRVYNNVLNTYPCFVHFNGGVWQTQARENIMPVFVEKINTSKQSTDIHTLDGYEQIITPTCYPHKQVN
jgi:hypothetical protein